MTAQDAASVSVIDAPQVAGAAVVPHGPKPRRISAGRIGVYAFLTRIGAVLPHSALRDDRHVAEGDAGDSAGRLFNLPADPTFQPWINAWLNACTGRDCNGLSPGFFNSLKITVPSVLVSIVCASINGYALTYWPYKGANILFGLLVFGAFVPYQVVIYPLIIGLSYAGLFSSLPGIIIVHTIFGMPILTLLFRNYLRVAAARALQGGARRRRRLLGRLLPDHDADVAADLLGRHHPAGDRHLERLSCSAWSSPGSPNYPMTVQLNNIVNSIQGVREYNVNMAATILTGLGAAHRSISSPAGCSCAASPPAR